MLPIHVIAALGALINYPAASTAAVPASVPKPSDQVVLAHIAAQKKLIQSEQTQRNGS